MACEPCRICGAKPSGYVYLDNEGRYVYRECGHTIPGQRDDGYQTIGIMAIAMGLNPFYKICEDQKQEANRMTINPSG